MYFMQLCAQCGITLSWEMIAYNIVIKLQMTLEEDFPSCSLSLGGTVLTLSIPGAGRDGRRTSPKPAAFFSFVSKAGICLYHYHTVGTKVFPQEKNGTSTWFCTFPCSLHVEGKNSLWLFPFSGLIIDHSENGGSLYSPPRNKEYFGNKMCCFVMRYPKNSPLCLFVQLQKTPWTDTHAFFHGG